MKAYRLAALLMLILVANPALAVRRHAGGGYVVKPHDTSYAICQTYGLTLSEFARLNPTIDVGSLKAGERVRVSGPVEPTPLGRKANAVGSKDSIAPKVTVQPDAVQPETAVVSEQPAKVVEPDKAAASPVKPVASSVAKESAKLPRVKPTPKAKRGGYLSNYYDAPASSTKESEPSVGASLMRVVGALVFVVAIAVISLYALKHFTSGKAVRKSPRRSIKVIETTGLGPNRALHVVQAGGKYLLIGSTPNGISLVAELSASEAEDSDSEKPSDFAGFLNRSSSNQDKADSASKLSDTIRDGASFLQKKTSAARSMRAKAESDES